LIRFFLILFLGALCSCTNNTDLVKSFVRDEIKPNEVISNAEMIHTENGVVKMILLANKIENFTDPSPYTVISRGFKVDFYENDSSLISTLNAQDAEINYDDKRMKALTDVSLESQKGNQLKSQELIWDQQENLIFTDKKVVIKTSNQIIEGQGFSSDPSFSTYKLNKIFGTMYISNQK
jgi:LPS export ABC transporter protein LptC